MPVISWPKPEAAVGAPSGRGRGASRRKAAEVSPAGLPPAPPSAALVNAILAYADVVEEIGDGLSLLRIGAARMDDKVIQKLLGREVSRLADVSIIWNEDEGEIHSVLDAATPLGIEAAEAGHDDPCFELTPLALAYLEAWSEDEGAVRAG